MKKKIAFLIFGVIISYNFLAQEPAFEPKPAGMDNEKLDGYRGIWFELNQKYKYGDKYSGGLGTYTTNHLPMAIYAEEVDKTFFVYGGTTRSDEKHLLSMIGYYDHKTEMVPQPTIVCDKMGIIDPHDNPVVQIDQDGYMGIC